MIVSDAGRGWWDPTSDAKGDVFGLVQRLERGLSFGHSASGCPNSLDCRRASHQSTGQGAETTGAGRSPNAGPSERLFGPILRPGDIFREGAGSPPRSSRLHPPPAFCGRGRAAAPGASREFRHLRRPVILRRKGKPWCAKNSSRSSPRSTAGSPIAETIRRPVWRNHRVPPMTAI